MTETRSKKAKSIMIQGTGSGVGKSIIAAGLCRVFARAGLRVAPFKAQNMALNSFVTADGGEMGRAQVVQAFAAGLDPTVDMNPILIKPTADTKAQVILEGRPIGNFSAVAYHERKVAMWEAVTASFDRLAAGYDLIVIEGAGSPAEINLKENDIVNMRMAKYADASVFLVGDIDKGGVFASLLGTLELLEDDERALIKGLIINKFRGDASLLTPGLRFIEERTGVPVTGVVPHVDLVIEEEDAVKSGPWSSGGVIDIAVIGLPHISNFTDFNALALEKGVSVRVVKRLSELGWPDAVLLPGSKNTLGDLEFLNREGFADAIKALASTGRPVIGICGGYQMLGLELEDSEGVESEIGTAAGLGLLRVKTRMAAEKETRQTFLKAAGGGPILGKVGDAKLEGYEIHMGRTELLAGARPAFVFADDSLGRVNDGAVDDKGLVIGTYLHGIFDNTAFRSAFLNALRESKGLAQTEEELDYKSFLDRELDKLADAFEESLDMEAMYRAAGVSARVTGGVA